MMVAAVDGQIFKEINNWAERRRRRCYDRFRGMTSYCKRKRMKLLVGGKCEYCSKKGRINVHHYRGRDIDNTLSIRWLCPECHEKLHTIMHQYRNRKEKQRAENALGSPRIVLNRKNVP